MQYISTLSREILQEIFFFFFLSVLELQLPFPGFGWNLAVLRIYVTLAIFQSYRDLEVGDNQSLTSYSGEPGESNHGPLARKPIQ